MANLAEIGILVGGVKRPPRYPQPAKGDHIAVGDGRDMFTHVPLAHPPQELLEPGKHIFRVFIGWGVACVQIPVLQG